MREFLVFMIPATIYLYVLMLSSLVLGRWFWFFRRLTVRFWGVALLVATISVFAVVTYHDVVLSNRHVTISGVSVERQGADRAEFVDQSRRAYYSLWTGVVALTMFASLVVARLEREPGYGTAIAFAIVVLVLFLILLPGIEYQNSCSVGESFLIHQHCR